MKNKVVKSICPYCKEIVNDLNPDHAGSVGDGENRWHNDCFWENEHRVDINKIKENNV